MRGATRRQSDDVKEQHIFQSTLLMRGATWYTQGNGRLHRISIHAPHARSDSIEEMDYESMMISIHAPHARSDRRSRLTHWRRRIFQSTLLMRGATGDGGVGSSRYTFQSTLLMRGATVLLSVQYVNTFFISIHAPHARSDTKVEKR